MCEHYYVVVGNDYAKFADQPDVYTISSFYKNMAELKGWPESDSVVVIGQGIGIHDREFIDNCLKEKNISRLYSIPPIASLEETHKHSEENVLITTPKNLGKFRYGFDLAITDKIDRLSDHVTGRHVGAILLMEASRQATIAALNLEYNKTSEQSHALILERFDSQFSGYLFPLPASLHTVIEEKKNSSQNICVTVETTVTQCEAEIGVLRLDVTLCRMSTIEKIEYKKSQKAVKQLRAQNSPTAALSQLDAIKGQPRRSTGSVTLVETSA